MKIFLFLFPFFIGMTAMAQNILNIPDTGWRLWLDREAKWQDDSLYLPGEFNLASLPINEPTGGWKTLNSKNGIPIKLPSTVEEHYWGVAGFRDYKGEYAFEAPLDTGVKNGSYLGVSWWWREMEVPESFKGKRVMLTIRGARFRAEVYINKQLVGYNIITETAFNCDVSDDIKAGKKNFLAIRITNPGGRMDWVDTEYLTWGKYRFHKSHGFGGIDRGMKLTSYDAVHFSDVWILNTLKMKSVTANGIIHNTTKYSGTSKVVVEVIDSDKKNVLCVKTEKVVEISPNGETEFQIEIDYPEAKLWSVENPKLYKMKATLTFAEGKKQYKDVREVSFGFRWFAPEGIGTNAILKFNGERIRLYSAISWGFWGINGLWPTPELAEREVKAAKRLGMNCIQFHRNIGKTEVLNAQDRLGLLRYMEPGGGQTALGEKFTLYAQSPKDTIDTSGKGGDAQTFAEKYMEEKLVRMVRDHRSHPSLIMYAIQNEINPDLHNPRIFRVLRRIHNEDPSRVVVLKSGIPPTNQAWMEPYSDEVYIDKGDGYSGWWDEHTVGGPGVWQDEMYKNPDDFTHRSTNDKEIVMWGEMLGAAAPDNHAVMVRELKKIGGKSYDFSDHIEVLEAYEKFLSRWGFRKAFPTAEALFTAIGNKSYDFWGRVMESTRLAEANDFYVMSGWESTAIENHSGMVDNLRNFKGKPELISARLSPLRPVLKLHTLVVKKGGKVTFDLFVLNETHKPHPSWLRLWMESPSGAVSELGIFDVPEFEQNRFVYPVKANVSTRALIEEGFVTLGAEIVGAKNAVTSDRVLVIDSLGKGNLPKRIGIVSIYPSLLKPFEIFPGVKAEPYDSKKEYDVLITANRLIQPPTAAADSAQKIEGTEDEELYRTINYGSPQNFDYIFPLLKGDTAKVTLKFAELFHNAEGVRVFDVAINGDTVLKDFDVFKEAGGKFKAIDKTFSIPTPEHFIRITVPRTKAGSARICAIKIESGKTVIAVNCGGKSYRDKKGLMWETFKPDINLTPEIFEKVKSGTPLLVLSEGDVATKQYAEQLEKSGAIENRGTIGEARAPWMGSWYFVREHPVFAGLPVNCELGSYYQVPVVNSGGAVVEGKDVEVIVGYSRDHEKNVAAGSFTTKIGKGKILFHSIPGVVSGLNGKSDGMQPALLKRLIANSLRWVM